MLIAASLRRLTLTLAGPEAPLWVCARPGARRELLLVPRDHAPLRLCVATARFWAALYAVALWVFRRAGEPPVAFLVPLGGAACPLDGGAGAADHRGLGDGAALHAHAHAALSRAGMAALAGAEPALVGRVLAPARPWSAAALRRLRASLAARAAAHGPARLETRLADIVQLLEGSS